MGGEDEPQRPTAPAHHPNSQKTPSRGTNPDWAPNSQHQVDVEQTKRGWRRRWGEDQGWHQGRRAGWRNARTPDCLCKQSMWGSSLVFVVLLLFLKRSMSCNILSHYTPSTEKPQRCSSVGKKASETMEEFQPFTFPAPGRSTLVSCWHGTEKRGHYYRDAESAVKYIVEIGLLLLLAVLLHFDVISKNR